MSPAARRRGTGPGALLVAAALLGTAGTGALVAASDPEPAAAATALRAGCRAPAPKAKGAGSSAAAVKRLVRSVTTDLTREPKPRSPSGRAPRRLVVDDVVRCTEGRRVGRGDTAEVRYTTVVWGGDRTPVDSSWDRRPSSTAFPLQRDTIIDGWYDGVPDMRVGGRRVLVVPPGEAYGAQGTPDGSIPGGATLIFVIDLVGVS